MHVVFIHNSRSLSHKSGENSPQDQLGFGRSCSRPSWPPFDHSNLSTSVRLRGTIDCKLCMSSHYSKNFQRFSNIIVRFEDYFREFPKIDGRLKTLPVAASVINKVLGVNSCERKLTGSCNFYARSPLLGACNSHNKPIQRHFHRPVYF